MPHPNAQTPCETVTTPTEKGGCKVELRVPTYEENWATFALSVERDADGDWRVFLPDTGDYEVANGIVYLGAPDAPSGPETFTVFAVYEEDGQPYATSVEAETAEQAIELAQAEADEGNGTHVPLTSFQVVRGVVEAIA